MPSRFRERWESFTKEQRLSVILLGFCGFFAVGLSMYQMNLHVREPFLADKAQAIAFKQSLQPSPDEEEAKQRRTDTDGDGLSDWDEVNVYHLNPNLKDTCGDGSLDNLRVATGKNMSCEGSSGNAVGAIDTSGLELATSTDLTALQQASNNSGSVVSQAIQGASKVQVQPIAASGSSTSSTLSVPRDPQAIRAALIGQVDQVQLDAVSDEQLLQYYDQALAQQNGSAASTSPSSSTGTSL